MASKSKMRKTKYEIARGWLVFWTLFIGIGALAGGYGMLSDPSGKALGMDGMLPYFQVLPFADVLFRDLTFSGAALIIVNGITNLTAAAFLFAGRKAGTVLGTVFGVTLMMWICIQFAIFPANFMSTIYFFFGLIQAVTGYCAFVFYSQEHFEFYAGDYKNIGTDPTRLVVYFSRMGYVKKAAYEEADRTGAEIYEIRATEQTAGTCGFWWCGRYGLHRWPMPIEPIPADLESYKHVTICSPIWVFTLAAPVREFCREASGKIREASLILLHHTKGRYTNARREAEELLKITMTDTESDVCRFGEETKV